MGSQDFFSEVFEKLQKTALNDPVLKELLSSEVKFDEDENGSKIKMPYVNANPISGRKWL